MTMYYAKYWECGKNTISAQTGRNAVTIQAYGSKNERDTACREFTPANHCPAQDLEPAKSNDLDVKRAIAEENVYVLDSDGNWYIR